MKVKELIALIAADGWIQVRTKGSHRQITPQNQVQSRYLESQAWMFHPELSIAL
jgi:predicted RNA binding protein YcfA (HicA-like mRNA interferase family)